MLQQARLILGAHSPAFHVLLNAPKQIEVLFPSFASGCEFSKYKVITKRVFFYVNNQQKPDRGLISGHAAY